MPGLNISIRAEDIFHIGSWPVTNGLFLSVIISLLLMLGAFLLGRRLKLIPGAAQNAAEWLIDGVLAVMDSVLGDRLQSEKYLPLVATIFLFVLCANWTELIPGVGSLFVRGGEAAPIFRSPSSDLNFTLALAVVTVAAVNVFGALNIGLGKHAGKFLNFSGPIAFFTGILEFVSECARIISFSFRLFGNIFAGEVLLLVTAFLVPYVVPLPFFLMETFVGLIQAFIFAMLALVFIAMAITEHEESHERSPSLQH